MALVFAVLAWQRPIIPDTQQIVRLGTPDNPHIINNDDEGRDFFEFIDENQGRKVRIFAFIDQNTVEVIRNSEGDFTGFWLKDPSNLSEREKLLSNTDQLMVHGVGSENAGLYTSSGSIFLSGYFASEGTITVRQDTTVRSITVIDIVTAVS